MSALRTTLRRLLMELFAVPSVFEAFFSDRFPSVQRLAGTGMDRTQQITLLLDRLAPHQVLGALMSHFSRQPEILAFIERECAGIVVDEAEINQQILNLSFEIAIRRAKNVPIDALSQRLREMKKRRRELRESPSLSPGHVLGGRYKLETIIGKGGFATVWLAFDYQTAGLVAIKVLHNEQASSPHQVERFARGARTIRSLNHPYIVRLLEEPQVDEGYHYSVLEYAPHGDLEAAVTKQGFSSDTALRCVLQVAQALAFAHQRSMIHRDVKPQNILVAADETARLTDFDLVHDDDTTGGTRTGALGTFLYAAPEQREDGSRVDMRADIYSIGMTAGFAIYGKELPQLVIQNSDRDAFISQLRCAKNIKDVIRHATKAAPADRYKTMGDFVTALERAMGPFMIAVPKPKSLPGERTTIIKLQTPTINRPYARRIFAASLTTVLIGIGISKVVTFSRQNDSYQVFQDASTGIDGAQALSKTGGLTIVSEPSQATVILDGTTQDVRTPVRVTGLSVGTHSIELVIGNRRWQKVISVTAGRSEEIKALFPEGTPSPAPMEQLSRDQISSGFKSAYANANCTSKGASGIYNVKVTIGRDGRVTDANVVSGGDGKDCVAKAVKSARFPEFSGDPMSLTYPFIVRPRPKSEAKDDLDSLLDTASAGSGGKLKKSEKNELPEQLSRDQISSGFKSANANVSSCTSTGASGIYNVKVTIGRVGRVTEANVVSGGDGKDCVAKAVKSARFPEFSGDPMSLTYPFIVRPKDDLDSLLDTASAGSGGKPQKAEKKELPEQLSRDQISSGFKSAYVSSCKSNGASGIYNVKVTIGRDGRVTEANVVSGGDGKDCVAKAVQSARFPEFSGDPMSLTYPFIVR